MTCNGEIQMSFTMALGKQKDHQYTQEWINFSILCKNKIAVLRHLNLNVPEIHTAQPNCLQRLILIGSLRKETQTSLTTFHTGSSLENVETINRHFCLSA